MTSTRGRDNLFMASDVPAKPSSAVVRAGRASVPPVGLGCERTRDIQTLDGRFAPMAIVQVTRFISRKQT